MKGREKAGTGQCTSDGEEEWTDTKRRKQTNGSGVGEGQGGSGSGRERDEQCQECMRCDGWGGKVKKKSEQ